MPALLIRFRLTLPLQLSGAARVVAAPCFSWRISRLCSSARHLLNGGIALTVLDIPSTPSWLTHAPARGLLVCSDGRIQQQSRRASPRIHFCSLHPLFQSLPYPIGFVLTNSPSLSPQIRIPIQIP